MLMCMFSLVFGLVDLVDVGIGLCKFDVLFEWVVEFQVEGYWVFVFSQFILFFDFVVECFDIVGIFYVYLDGLICYCQKVVDGFIVGEQFVFLISLKVGGFGLMLIEVDYVFFLDLWWNLVVEVQVVDCMYCIGQESQVFVYWMIVIDMIEEKVFDLQCCKVWLFIVVLDDEVLFVQLFFVEDICGLFEG